MHVQEWLETVPAISVYLLVGLVIGLESLGVPLPGEIILVSGALLASQYGEIDPVVLGASASAGAIIGDSIGYGIGLSHVMIDFRRDDLARMLELLDLVTGTIRPAVA